MGAALSTSNNSILVALEKPQFAPGDVVQVCHRAKRRVQACAPGRQRRVPAYGCRPPPPLQGVVCLNVLQPIHTTGLYLKARRSSLPVCLAGCSGAVPACPPAHLAPQPSPPDVQIKGFERTQWVTEHSRQKSVTKTRYNNGRSESYTDYETGWQAQGRWWGGALGCAGARLRRRRARRRAPPPERL